MELIPLRVLFTICGVTIAKKILAIHKNKLTQNQEVN